MTDRNKTGAPRSQGQEELDRFRSIRHLINHWSRPISPRSYYWYLTFEHSPELQSMAQNCQQSLPLPYYDLTPPPDLHMTLDRIAFEDKITPQRLEAIASAAATLCLTIAPLEVTVGHLGGTRGALGFTAYPRQPIQDLRDKLRATTLAIHPSANVRAPTFHPHVAIAYCNSDGIAAAEAIAAIEALNATAETAVTINDVSLVLLTRLPQAYQWETVTRIPLMGTP